ncbi:MAG: hypothetical protein AAGC79_02210 [Pseudomonadota bacterium]
MKLDGVRPYSRRPFWQQAFDALFMAASVIGLASVALMGVLILTGQL